MMKLYNGDCLEIMKELPSETVDLILCDLPYGFTDCKWDTIIPFDDLWKEYRRLLKPKGVCILFGNQPFTTKMIHSNLKEFSHVWYWKKNYSTGFLNCKKQPLKCVEDIAVFVCNQPGQNNSAKHHNLRNYMFSELEKSGFSRKDIDKVTGISMSSHYFTWGKQFAIPSKKNWEIIQRVTGCFNRDYDDVRAEYAAELGGNISTPYTYNPQGLKDVNVKVSNDKYTGTRVYSPRFSNKEYTQTKTGYPKNVLEFNGLNSRDRVHPTQKPVELLEYLINTYTNEGETVLDNCMGSGSTGVACKNTGRRFIGIEIDRNYYDIAVERVGKCG